MGRGKSKYIGEIINGFEILDSKCVKKRTMYKVKCIYCGKEELKSNATTGQAKCSCQYNYGKTKNWSYIDGRSKDRLYRIHTGIKRRCTNKDDYQYHLYGGRGIKVCDEWLNDYRMFRKWAYENGYDDKAPKGKYTLDRIDVNGNYEPSNCRWITTQEQAKNRRTTRFITYNGKTLCAKDWAREIGINYCSFLGYVNNGMTIEEIIKKKGN